MSIPGLDGETVHVFVEPAAPTTAEEVRNAVLSLLPQIPEVRVHLMEALPRNAIGKVQRNVLRSDLGSRNV